MAAGRVALLLWVTLRLPLLLLLAFAGRETLIGHLERQLGLGWPTQIVIVVVSTMRERALLFVACLALLSLGWIAFVRGLASNRWAHWLYGTVAFAGLLGFFGWAGGAVAAPDVVVAALLACILMLNLPRPETRGEPESTSRAAGMFFGCTAGSGVLFPQPFFGWLAGRLGESGAIASALRRMPGPLLGCAIVSLAAVGYLNGSAWRYPQPKPPIGVTALQQALHDDPAVEKFAEGDFNWIELGRDGHTLYATGHGVGRVLAFDVDALDRPPAAARVPTTGAEDFAYDREANELYVYRQQFREVAVIDAATLDLRRKFRLEGIAPGDATVMWSNAARELLILSEVPSDSAFLVVDGATGRVRQRLGVAAGSGGLMDPKRPRLYLTFFRDRDEIVVYDTEQRALTLSVTTAPRIDGMAFDARADQLLVGSPLHSAVLRYDAETLERATDLDASFGVRSLAIDPERRLLLAASLATNGLQVIDLESGESLARYELGPWLRKIWLDVESGSAYVSSRYGIYRVHYTERLPGTSRAG